MIRDVETGDVRYRRARRGGVSGRRHGVRWAISVAPIWLKPFFSEHTERRWEDRALVQDRRQGYLDEQGRLYCLGRLTSR